MRTLVAATNSSGPRRRRSRIGQVAQHRAQRIGVEGAVIIGAEDPRQPVQPGGGREHLGQVVDVAGPETMQIWRAQGLAPVAPRRKRDIARCTVERLMKVMGLQGVVRGKKVVTTNPDTAQPCPDDKVNRAFVADMPNQLWGSDFTYVSSWQGMVYVAFVIDVFARKIVGWRVSTSMTTGFVLDALNQAICQRAPGEADKLIHHSDRGLRKTDPPGCRTLTPSRLSASG